MKQSIQDRFSAKVRKTGANGCHEWTGCVMKNGYGQINIGGRAAYAHRVAWELQSGTIPNGLYVLHRCDNRKCVNSKHLWLGTFDDNMHDMVQKRRQAHGSRNGHAKLAEADIVAIRKSSEKQADICSRYGVTQPLVSMIRSGKIWREVGKI